eukprot:scaffold12500_cov51-Phaeocystis_antarctica.AAC.1
MQHALCSVRSGLFLALDDQIGHRRRGRLEVGLVERRVGAAVAAGPEAPLDESAYAVHMQCSMGARARESARSLRGPRRASRAAAAGRTAATAATG